MYSDSDQNRIITRPKGAWEPEGIPSPPQELEGGARSAPNFLVHYNICTMLYCNVLLITMPILHANLTYYINVPKGNICQELQYPIWPVEELQTLGNDSTRLPHTVL